KPKVTLAASTTNVTLGQPLTLTAVASEDGGAIAKVAFYAGSSLLFESTSPPYTYTYTPGAAGALTYTAIATDTAGGATTSSPVSVTVGSGGGTPPPVATPKVAMAVSPTSVTLGQPVTLTATASEDGGTIAKVAFYAGGALVKTLTAAPYTTTYTPTSAGSLTFTAIATDGKGVTATSANANLTINPVAGATPKVSLATSATNISVLQTVTLTATASEDGGTIRKVGFYVNGKLIVERTAAPYTYTYTPAVGGMLAFSAVATDTKNVTATSSTVALTVNVTPAPGTTITAVDFFRNGTKINASAITAKPYTFPFALATAGQ